MIPFNHLAEVSKMVVCSDYFFDAFRFWEAVAVFWIRSCWAFFSAFFLLRDSEIFFLCSSESGIPFVVFFSGFNQSGILSSESDDHSCVSEYLSSCSLQDVWRSESMSSIIIWNADFLVSLNARMNAQNTRASPAIMNHSWSENHGILLMWKSANQ